MNKYLKYKEQIQYLFGDHILAYGDLGPIEAGFNGTYAELLIVLAEKSEKSA
jgi:hypothetical protein